MISKPLELTLSSQTVFFNAWKTGLGKGETRKFGRGTPLIITERARKGRIQDGDRVRVKVAGYPDWQAYVELGLEALIPADKTA
jgi:hypothetical protein